MSSSVEQIKSKIDIVSLISSYIKLEKAGANFKGKCPFHNEKTPSFFVSPDRGSYYCFGCQAKGDIFTFVEEFEGLDFVGSLKVLAEKAGVTLEKFDRGDKTEKDKLFNILAQAGMFYQRKLSENAEALEYLHKRGIKDETIKSFSIGFAPADWRQLYEFLISKNISAKDMLSVGLIKQKEGSKDTYYDTFRGRIMFPINDSSGRIVGFSGRILVADEKSPKYLNSPETELFNKSEILFGLDKAKKDIRIKDYSILVEGQMDLVMMHQIGISNTVASSGTALTVEHLIKLRRLSNRIIMSFDGDSAGFAASDRSAKLVLSLGMELKVAQMPEGQDPADLAKENSEMLKNCLKNSKHIIDFYLDSLLSKNLDSRVLGKEILKNVLPYVALLTSNIEKAHFIKNIAQKTFIKEDALWEDLKKVNVVEVENEINEKIKTVKNGSVERRIFGVLFWQKSLKTPTVSVDGIENKIEKITNKKIKDLLFEFENEKDLLSFEAESYYNGNEKLESEIEDLLNRLEEDYLKNEFEKTMILLQKAERDKDSSKVLELLEICQNISQKINKLKNEKK